MATPYEARSPPRPPHHKKRDPPVRRLSWSVDERSLTDAFSSFGTVTEDGARDRCSTRCRGGREPLHREVFDEMPVRDIVACSAAIYRHARSGSFHQSVGLFVGMTRDGVCPNSFTLVGVLLAAAGLGDTVLAKCIHGWAVKRRLESNPFVATALVDAYAKFKFGLDLNVSVTNSIVGMYLSFGDIEIGREIFRKIIVHDVVTWTMMMGFLLELAHASEVISLFVQMRFELCVQLHGYSYKSAHKVFDDMISRDVVSWNTMILSYGINGQGRQAIALFNDMEESSEERDSVTYLNTMLACSHSGLVDDGLIVFRKMINENRINPCQEHIGCLVDMLARAGRLDEAAEVASLTNKVGSNSWKALMGGGYLHNDTELTEVAAEKVLKMKSIDYGHVVLLSNTYASAGNWAACCTTGGLPPPGVRASLLLAAVVACKRLCRLGLVRCSCCVSVGWAATHAWAERRAEPAVAACLLLAVVPDAECSARCCTHAKESRAER
nr:unnamed protein product [Digitaria exilis]